MTAMIAMSTMIVMSTILVISLKSSSTGATPATPTITFFLYHQVSCQDGRNDGSRRHRDTHISYDDIFVLMNHGRTINDTIGCTSTTSCQHCFVPTLLSLTSLVLSRHASCKSILVILALTYILVILALTYQRILAGLTSDAQPSRGANTTLCQHYVIPTLLCASTTLR